MGSGQEVIDKLFSNGAVAGIIIIAEGAPSIGKRTIIRGRFSKLVL